MKYIATFYNTRFSFFLSISFIFFAAAVNAQGNGAAKPSSLRVLAYQYIQENKQAEAEAAFLKAIQVEPKNISNYNDIALLYLREKRYDEAEREIKTALKLQNNNLELRSILAKIYVEKGDKPAATQILKSIIIKDPKNVYAYYALMNLNSTGPNDKNRKASLIKLLSLSPANIIFRLELAELFAANNKADSTLYFLQSVKKIAA